MNLPRYLHKRSIAITLLAGLLIGIFLVREYRQFVNQVNVKGYSCGGLECYDNEDCGRNCSCGPPGLGKQKRKCVSKEKQ
jgi:hypothetical protein